MKKLLLICALISVSSLFAQTVSYTVDVSSGCSPLTVNFTNTTTGGSSYEWYFDDGNSSFQVNPSHTYTQPGTYFPVLYAYDAFGGYMGQYDMQITVSGGSTTMQLDKDTICPEESINIWSNSYNGDSYDIDYGDGTPIESNSWGSFYHEYTSAGMYIITLNTYTSTCGVTAAVDTVWVGTNVAVNDAFIDVSADTVCPGDEVNFWTNWGYTWVMDFGDGNTSSNNSYHSYAQTGSYVVNVTVMNGCGNFGTAQDTIVVHNNVPIDPWSVYLSTSEPACPGSDMYFWAPSGFSDYYWNFGNGNTTSEQYPEIEFGATGDYPVSLTITNGCGIDTTILDTVTVDTTSLITWAEFDMPDSVCLGESLMYDVDSDNEDDFYWDFGDGNTSTLESGSHTYANAGTYYVSCLLTNGCGHDTTLYDTVYVGTNVGINQDNIFYQVFPDEACPGDTILFIAFPGGTDAVYSWDFGDGNGGTNANGETVTINNEFVYDVLDHAYPSSGTYSIEFTATNTCGYSYTDSGSIEIGPGATPEPSILYNEDAYNCLGAEIEFMAVGGAEFVWNFGDGTGNLVTNGTLEPVTHVYSDPGTYEISMAATNNCGLSADITEEIFIPDNEMQLVSTSVDAHCGYSDGVAVVSISGGTPPYDIQWSTGDSTNVADSLTAGIYFVTVTDFHGCSKETVATVSDEEAPTIVLNAQIDVSCYDGDDGALDINLIGSSAPYTYSWSSGSASEDINNLSAGPYELMVSDANGCVATESFVISEPDPVNISFTSTPAQCNQNDGTATVNVNGNTGPYVYSWDNGMNTQTINGLSPGVYHVNVIDNNGCLYNGSVPLSETNAPYIILDSLIQVGCGGSLASIYISPMGGSGPYNYQWTTGSNNQDLVNVSSGEYSVMLTGANGCSSVEHFEIEEFSPDPMSLCMVSVNPIANHNQIIWEESGLSPDIKSFNIYKESSQSGVYYLVGNVPLDSLSVFVDEFSDPTLHAWRYKIAAVDSCGNESLLSTAHKTLHLTSNVGVGGDINLIWDGYVGFSFSSYNIWRYTDVDGWNMIQTLQNNLNSYTDAPPQSANTLHYYVEALPDNPCVSTRANHNTTRSNKSAPIGGEIDTTVGITPRVDLDINIYPNPTNGKIFVDVDPGSYDQVDVIDVSGKTCMSVPVSNSRLELDMCQMERGMYLFRFTGANGARIEKVILNK